MARKIQYLSDVTLPLTPDQIEVWGENIKAAGTVLDSLAAYLQKQIEQERGKLTLDKLLTNAEPLNELLARQAKIEAYQKIIDLVIDK